MAEHTACSGAEPWTARRRSPAAGFAARFAAASAGGQLRLAEIPFLTQINLRVDARSNAAERIGLALGAPLPVEPGRAVRSGDLTVLWLGPDEWLVLGPDEEIEGGAATGSGGAGLRERLAEAAAGPAVNAGQVQAPGSTRSRRVPAHVSVVDVSAQRTTFVIGGVRVRDLLAHGLRARPASPGLRPKSVRPDVAGACPGRAGLPRSR